MSQIADFALEAIAAALAFFYDLPVIGGSYGVAIIMLTIAVMIVLMPLTLKATRSTIKMTQLQPQLRALQKKHKDDRQTLNQEMMALYQRNGVNPVGGCLPMLAQLPVFLLLFNILRGLSRRVNERSYYALGERVQELVGAPPDPGGGETFDPKYLDTGSQMYKDLAQETEMGFLGIFDLSAQPWDVLQDSPIKSIPYLLLIVFVVGTSYYQQRQISSRRGATPDNPTPQQQTQQQLLRILPLMSGVWSFAFPAGLVLYWATSNTFRIGQQAYISRALYAEDAESPVDLVDDVADDDVEPEDDGPKDRGSSKPKSGSDKTRSKRAGAEKTEPKKDSTRANGTSNGSTPADRNERWERRRQAQAKKRESKRGASTPDAASRRTTPKGTKPTDSKRKRKR